MSMTQPTQPAPTAAPELVFEFRGFYSLAWEFGRQCRKRGWPAGYPSLNLSNAVRVSARVEDRSGIRDLARFFKGTETESAVLARLAPEVVS